MVNEDVIRKLGRRVEFDWRSRLFNINALLEAKPLRSYTWRCHTQLDQKKEGSCVGFAWGHELAARPAEVKNVVNNTGTAIYKEAQKLDQWPGENYDGTSVLAGVKAIQKLYPHAIEEYRWAFTLNDVLLTLGYYSPVVIGVNWYSGMSDPDSEGMVHATGAILGGHAILAREVNMRRKVVRLKNSWGTDWGKNGDCFISFDDLNKLLGDQGEACIVTKRNLVTLP